MYEITQQTSHAITRSTQMTKYLSKHALFLNKIIMNKSMNIRNCNLKHIIETLYFKFDNDFRHTLNSIVFRLFS